MIEVSLQYKDGIFYPFSAEDKERASEFKDNQVVIGRLTGTKKTRSLKQLRLFWQCCKKIAENTNDENWNSKERVAEQVKIKCQYIKSYIVVGKAVHIITGSISYKEMSHMQACNFINRAIEEMAKHIGVTVDDLTREAEKEN